jgi:cell division protein FtsB
MTQRDSDTEKQQQELDELQHEIDEVRREADPLKSDEPKYVDSGTIGEEYDDQTIAPPG